MYFDDTVLGDSCMVNEDCKSVDHAECDVNNRCSCQPWYKERDSTTCVIKGKTHPTGCLKLKVSNSNQEIKISSKL